MGRNGSKPITQLQYARRGVITDAMRRVAEREELPPAGGRAEGGRGRRVGPTGGEIARIRQAIIDTSTVPIGTVPIYQAVTQVKRVEDLTPDDFVAMIEHQAKQGTDYQTIPAGGLPAYL